MSSDNQKIECTIPLRVQSICVLCNDGHPDSVMLNLSDATARRLHGDTFDIHGGATLSLLVSKGRAADAIHMMGFCSDLPVLWIENNEKRETTVAEI